MPAIILLLFFETVNTANKNQKSKNGDIKLANTFIDIALSDMQKWIGKGTWSNGYGAAFIGFRDCMQRYYLRLTGQVARQAQVYTSVAPLRTLDNSLRLYIKEARKAAKTIPSIL